MYGNLTKVSYKPLSRGAGGGGGTPFDGLHREAPPKRGIFFWLQVYERAVI